MSSKKFKKILGNEAKNLLKESVYSKDFHGRIQNEIQQSKLNMKERRDRFQIIQNK